MVSKQIATTQTIRRFRYVLIHFHLITSELRTRSRSSLFPERKEPLTLGARSRGGGLSRRIGSQGVRLRTPWRIKDGDYPSIGEGAFQ